MIINPYIYGVATSYDPDAQLFITATGISGTNATATNQLVVDLKAANIWTKMKSIYPFVGGTATTHKFNLKDPRDTNAAFRLQFLGGWTHSTNGALPNGVDAYAETYLAPNPILAQNSASISFYSRTNSIIDAFDMGVSASPSTGISALLIASRWSTGQFQGRINATTNTVVTNANSMGFYQVSRLNSTNQTIYKNTTATIGASTSTGLTLVSINIGRWNNPGGSYYYSARECAFSTIGDGLTDLESQLFYQITEKYQVALSRNINTTQSFYYNSAYNNETNAFLFSTQITDATIQTATNILVTDLKTAGIYTKMKALYPMVGGTATTHKFNLVNAQDTNEAFRLTFAGGGTHSSNGYQPGGVNGYANTFLIPSTAYSVANSGHMSYYSRTDSNGANEREMGGLTATVYSDLTLRYSNTAHMRWSETSAPTTTTSLNSLGYYVGSRTTSTSSKVFKNGTQILSSGLTGNSALSIPFFIGAINLNGSPSGYYSAKQCAFSSIGDGLTDVESQVFYQITEKYQVALGRNVNPTQTFYYNTAYNNETNAFLFSTQITDTTTQIATNTLVSDLKTANIFTKMKAIYPMVGGTATTHKYNLINPQDTDAAFRLSFVGGWTHSVNGTLPNGTNAYANTFLSTGTNLSLNSGHLSYYSRTNNTTSAIDIGSLKPSPDSYSDLVLYYTGLTYFRFNNAGTYDSVASTNTLGFYISSRTASNIIKTYKNGSTIINGTAPSNTTSTIPFFIGAANNTGTAQYFANRQCAFASIGDGLTDAEALALYNAVNTFQVSLARNV